MTTKQLYQFCNPVFENTNLFDIVGNSRYIKRQAFLWKNTFRTNSSTMIIHSFRYRCAEMFIDNSYPFWYILIAFFQALGNVIHGYISATRLKMFVTTFVKWSWISKTFGAPLMSPSFSFSILLSPFRQNGLHNPKQVHSRNQFTFRGFPGRPRDFGIRRAFASTTILVG